VSKILKNTTGASITIDDTGVTLLIAPATFTIPPEDFLTWAASSDIVGPVGVGDVVVNDGSDDLDPSEGMELLDGNFTRVFVEFEGTQNHLFATTLTTPGVSQTLISTTVAASKELRLHGVQVTCRRPGVFTIIEGATTLATGRTGASSMNPSVNFKKQRKVATGVTLKVDFLAASGPASDIEVYVDNALIDV